MIDLYGTTTPNAVKIMLACEEMDLPYTFIFADVLMGVQFEDWFGKMNPNRKVPVVVDSEGPGGKPFTIWESGAILIYLAEKTGRFLPKSGAERYTCIQWVMYQMANQGPMFGQDVHFRLFAPPGNEYGYERYKSQVRKVYDVVNDRLAESPYIAGDEYSIADMAIWPWFDITQRRGFGHDPATIPHLVKWMKVVEDRPATQRAMKLHATIKRHDIEQYKRDHPDKLDRFTGREGFIKRG